jgi:hypothetical protein
MEKIICEILAETKEADYSTFLLWLYVKKESKLPLCINTIDKVMLLDHFKVVYNKALTMHNSYF